MTGSGTSLTLFRGRLVAAEPLGYRCRARVALRCIAASLIHRKTASPHYNHRGVAFQYLINPDKLGQAAARGTEACLLLARGSLGMQRPATKPCNTGPHDGVGRADPGPM